MSRHRHHHRRRRHHLQQRRNQNAYYREFVRVTVRGENERNEKGTLWPSAVPAGVYPSKSCLYPGHDRNQR